MHDGKSTALGVLGLGLMAARGRSGLEIGTWSLVWVGLLGANGYLAWRRRRA